MPTRREFVATVAIGVAASCLPGRRASGKTTEKVRVAAILPFSGGLEIFGTQARVGLDLAQAEINQDDGITFMHQANRAELFDDIVLNYLGFEEPYMAEIGPITGKGLFVGTPLVSSDHTPAIENFVARIRKSTAKGVFASEYALTHYNAPRALKLGIEKSGKASREAAINGMAGLTFDSPTGPVAVDAVNHHVTLNMFLGKALGSR